MLWHQRGEHGELIKANHKKLSLGIRSRAKIRAHPRVTGTGCLSSDMTGMGRGPRPHSNTNKNKKGLKAIDTATNSPCTLGNLAPKNLKTKNKCKTNRNTEKNKIPAPCPNFN